MVSQGRLVRRRVLILLLILLLYASGFIILKYGVIEMKTKVSPFVMPIISEYNVPLDRPTGLAFDGEALWISSAKNHLICAVDHKTGVIIRKFTAPISAPWGLAWDGRFLWVADFQALRIHQVNITSGKVVSSIKAPGITSTGLAWDGTNLWLSDFSEHMIFKIDHLNGSVLQSFRTPKSSYNPSGLAWDGSSIWVADLSASYVFKVEPSDGTVVSYYYSSGYYPSGLAWDGQHLWLLDYSENKVYKTLPCEQTYKVTQLSVPSWFWLACVLSIFPVLLSIISALKPKEEASIGEEKLISGSTSGCPRMETLSIIALMIAVLGSIYISYELFRIIYSVVVLNKLVLRGNSPLWLYRFEMFFCLYTCGYWIYYALMRVLYPLLKRL